MHGHELQILLGRDDSARSSGGRNPLQTGNREVRPNQMNAHEPRQDHANHNCKKSKPVVLFADYLMVYAEDIFANETLRRGVMCEVRGNVMHVITSGN